MRIGTSRSDRIGFIVFVALASLLAVLVFILPKGDDSASVQSVANFGSAAAGESIAASPIETTEPVAMPELEVEVQPLFAAASAPDTGGSADEAMTEDGTANDTEDAMADDVVADDDGAAAPAADTDTATSSASDEAAPATTETELTNDDSAAASAAVQAQPAETEVPNPQPQATATAVPNPQPQETTTAVPNPQPQETTTAVPNPQPQETTTAVPNPQAPAQNVSAPAPAPQGGTFTHTLTATVSRPTLYTAAGGTPFTPTFNGTALPAVNPTVFGNPLVYRVLAGSPDDGSGWAQVYVPARPNGTKAWVQTSQFRWGSSNRMLQINVSTNTVTVFDGGNVLLTTSAVTGKSSSRTPLANGWVEEVMAGPSGAYGPTLISLGIFSDALNSFGGSVPKIALHGTNSPGLMGQYASNGCIRVRNEIITQIAGLLPIGSKVQIVA